jgi:protoporphyrinogen oxidase
MSRVQVAIVGGGITGVSLAYFLSRRGITVEIFEASPMLGGLAGPLLLQDGTSVDRFYHAILPSDDELATVCDELHLTEQLRFKQTRNAFFVNGKLSTMNSALEFLRFPPLSLPERVRLAMTIVRAQLVKDWRQLEDVSVHDWLGRWSGKGVCNKLWLPMLDAKFDKVHDQIPATWMWSRLVRMKSTRSGANQRESSGHLIGGYATLLAAMARQIESAGGRIHLACPVQEVVVRHGRAVAVRTAGGSCEADAIVSTMQAPVTRRLIPGAPASYQEALSTVPYLGVVCPLVVMDRPLSDYWVLNIADRAVPFTGIIETTSYIDPQYVGGHHLVYLPKYTAPGSAWLEMPDADIREHVVAALKRIAPDFDPRSVRQLLIHRERYVEPLHRMRGLDPIPAVETPVDGLYLATTAQIYPALTNGESVIRHARAVADVLVARADASAAMRDDRVQAAAS